MTEDDNTALGLLGVLMRRENRRSITVTYEELSREPIQLIIETDQNRAVTVTRCDFLTDDEKAQLQREADAHEAPFARATLLRSKPPQ